jgi:hypothetical protein
LNFDSYKAKFNRLRRSQTGDLQPARSLLRVEYRQDAIYFFPRFFFRFPFGFDNPASLIAIATACFRLVTLLPELDFNVPRLYSPITL